MIIYLFYNADLLEIPKGRHQLALGFVDDSAFLVSGAKLEDNNSMLRRMMERPNGAYNWSKDHNSKFETSKFELLHFTQRREPDPNRPNKTRRLSRPPIVLRGTTIKPTNVARFLGVMVDDELRWKEHAKYAIGKGTKYTLMFRRLTRPSTGLKPEFMERLFTTVAVPKFAYAADIWYMPIRRKEGHLRDSGSVGFARQLTKVHRMALIAVTGAMRSAPTDALELHANLPPVDLLLDKICHRSTVRIATLPKAHPLHKRIQNCVRYDVRRHRSPLHNLAKIYHVNPDDMETIDPVRQLPTYQRPFTTDIAETREASLEDDKKDESSIKIYTDGSGYKGHAGAAAIMFINEGPPTKLQYYLGPLSRNTTFEAEAVGVSLGLQLLMEATLPRTTTVALDNQGVIQSTAIYRQRQSHYHFDAIHEQARRIARKERNRANFAMKITWISGHSGAKGNEMVDAAAKEAAEGMTSDRQRLPKYLRKERLPTSVSALKQQHNSALKNRWQERWGKSPRFRKYQKYKDSFPFAGFRRATMGLTRRQHSLVVQLRTGHAPLNQHLHRMKVVDEPKCPHCPAEDETVRHYLYQCRRYKDARTDLITRLGRDAHVAAILYRTKKGIKNLLQFVADTERLKKTFGDVTPSNIEDDENDDYIQQGIADEIDYDWEGLGDDEA
ncbi:hypothetical protein D9615_004786 [Tricholomella constricta]|uniref:RNase H type-1 domain-containing protein n=1 Tax=Tricholomella constricta TaxID=117010 RepID=A0A8H5M749_9AGAR|nr:hypothetical protein D9615_004786 [Tricholomella constricta]